MIIMQFKGKQLHLSCWFFNALRLEDLYHLVCFNKTQPVEGKGMN